MENNIHHSGRCGGCVTDYTRAAAVVEENDGAPKKTKTAVASLDASNDIHTFSLVIFFLSLSPSPFLSRSSIFLFRFVSIVFFDIYLAHLTLAVIIVTWPPVVAPPPHLRSENPLKKNK